MRSSWALLALSTPFLLTACIDDDPAPGDSLGEESAALVLDDLSPGQLVAGTTHACVVMRDGTVRCWGAGTDGQLGDGAAVDRFGPVTPVLPARALRLAAGDAHTCAALVTGEVACWGDGSAGQNGTMADQLTPTIVPGLSGVISLAAGSLHTCALHGTGRVSCWGANTRGQLGDGTGVASVVPRTVVLSGSPLAGIRQISAGGDRTCALNTTPAMYCWGDNVPDQNGPYAPGTHHLSAVFTNHVSSSAATTGDTTCRTRFISSTRYECVGTFQVPQTTTTTIAHIDASDRFLCYLNATGRVYCRGANDHGQLANGTTDVVATPLMIPLANVVASTVGDDFACALDTAGTVFCWGKNDRGQIGDGVAITDDRLVPHAVALTSQARLAVDLDVGGGGAWIHACVLDDDVRCVGNNASGQLGNGTTTSTMTPVVTIGPESTVAVSAGTSHTCALRAGGTLRCWGNNSFGQLGNNTTTSSTRPVATIGIYVDVAAGQTFTCGVRVDGSVGCWGRNDAGQLGVPTSKLGYSPYPRTIGGFIEGVSYMVAVEAGHGHACALERGGWLWCWGRNTYRQASSNAPLANGPPWLLHGSVRDFALGQNHTCTALLDGTVRCWGRNAAGQLGDGTQIDRVAAVTPAIDRVVAITTGSDHTCALRDDGTAHCWGGNSYGQLGVGHNTFRTTPTPVALGGARLLSISGGDVGTCGVRTDGVVLCWGLVGQGTAPPSLLTNTPTVMNGL